MEKYEFIVEKARELARMIENNEITVRYRESVEKMKHDAVAQRLLAELVRIGGELNNISGTDAEMTTGKAELEMLKNEFDNNIIVKDHILAQKEYLDMIKMVQERIKNPEM
ncbi:MAG: hypothetical protein CVV49_19495 [Spirochaetae bacterium HGW-Spirochaetae-5]|nr:MAG: hypothetical protein CVV49_19495 [Spirochaetae bacterium HGW-Spirochaetae-5]